MKIAHLCLSNFYIDGFSYQENELVRQNVADGHDVVVIASTETIDRSGQFSYCLPRLYMGTDGARVIRLPYSNWLPLKVMRKLRMHPGVFNLLESEKPDVVLFHSLCGWELLTIKKYKKAYPKVRVYADSHEDFNNSARSFLSRYLLHKFYYRTILLHALDSIEKVLCISMETISFVRDFYGVPERNIEFFPLGGFIYDDDDYERIRSQGRAMYGVTDNQVLFVQSGKMDATKKVLESLKAFTEIDNPDTCFFLAGHLHDDVAVEAIEIIKKDRRIKFLGWLSADELRTLLCAADVYIQPGTQSATMQMSLCARCAVILDDVPSHVPYVDGNGWLVADCATLKQAMKTAASNLRMLHVMSSQSEKIARILLDYRILAQRIYS